MRTPPTFRCSAVTPFTPMPLMRSTSAGGNDSSMPYRTPIRAIYRLSPHEEFFRHAMPPRPIVSESLPHIQHVRDALHAQGMRQLHVLIEQRVAIADHQYIIAVPYAIQKPRVFQARQIIER